MNIDNTIYLQPGVVPALHPDVVWPALFCFVLWMLAFVVHRYAFTHRVSWAAAVWLMWVEATSWFRSKTRNL